VFALPEMRWAAAALALFLCGLAVQLLGGPAWALYLAGYLAGGWQPGLAGLRALREKTLDVDLLMVVAAIGAAAIGQVMDGGLLIVIFATSGALEALATARTEDSVRGLLDLAPDTATKVHQDGTEQQVAATDLTVDDVLLIRPGERIAADGIVLDGASEVDQATITGEPLPVGKTSGDQVFAGTINGTGSLRVQVERHGHDSVVARIAALVEQASRTKARTQLFIEKVERRYSIGMVATTIALFAIPLLWGDPITDSLLRAMTFMIVASPCAVVLATMPPLLAAIANAGRRGVLVKSAVVMEQFGAATTVAFDKTGTLTHGIPALAELRLLPDTALVENRLLPGAELTENGLLPDAAVAENRLLPDVALTENQLLSGAELTEDRLVPDVAVADNRLLPGAELTENRLLRSTALAENQLLPGAALTENQLLRLVAAAELPSEHPLAAAIVRAARERGLSLPVAHEFAAQPGRGVTARVDGHRVQVGAPNVVATTIDDLQRRGYTTSVVLLDDEPVGVLALTDQLRAEAADTVAATTRLTGAAPVLLTGDNPNAAARIAEQVGITDVRAGLLPEDKVAAVRELTELGERVVVVGDGVNDAPALAAAHAGVAMGGAGADLALHAADVIIVRDDLSAVPALIALSARARRVVVANLVVAAVFIAGLVLWDLLGHLPLPLGVAGHEGSTVIVGLNGLRLLRTNSQVRPRAYPAKSLGGRRRAV
jgi:cation transport ATPase